MVVKQIKIKKWSFCKYIMVEYYKKREQKEEKIKGRGEDGTS